MSKYNAALPDAVRMAELIATPGPTDSPLPVRGNLTRFGQRIRWAEQVVQMLIDSKWHAQNHRRVKR